MSKLFALWKANRKALGVMGISLLTILWQTGLIDGEMGVAVGSAIGVLTGARMFDRPKPQSK